MTPGQFGQSPAVGSALAGSMHNAGGRQVTLTQTPLELTNEVVGDITDETNLHPAAASPSDVPNDMSPANREAAHVLRYTLAGSYFLVLLLLLAYAGYRYWRWKKEAERKRRQRQPSFFPGPKDR